MLKLKMTSFMVGYPCLAAVHKLEVTYAFPHTDASPVIDLGTSTERSNQFIQTLWAYIVSYNDL